MPARVRGSRQPKATRWLVLVAVLGLVALLAQCAFSGRLSSTGSLGLGDRLYPALGNGGYDVQSYRLAFDIHDPTEPFQAEAVVEAIASQNLSRFTLDLVGNTVADVTVDGRAAAHDREEEKLVVTPAVPLSAHHAFQVVVRYTVEPARRKADSPWLIQPDGFTLDAQPAGAHAVFPSNDHPSDKALFTIRLVVPEGVTAVANGVLADEQRDGDRTAFTYKSQNPMATELIQLAVGSYTVLRQAGPHGLALRHVVPSDQVRELRPVVERTNEHIAWLEQRLGPYPFETYGVLAVPAYDNGALESQTLALFDTGYLTGDPARAEPLMVHELAHQWFGNSVTPRTWSDLWLNEGPVTWYEWVYATERGWPPPNGQSPDFERRMRETYAAGDRWRKWYGPVARPKSADSLFNQNVYDGGALVLYALQEKVGAAKFGQIQRTWVTEHRGGVVGTKDFTDLASRIAGEDLTGFLNDWLYGVQTPPMPGHPDWTVRKAH